MGLLIQLQHVTGRHHLTHQRVILRLAAIAPHHFLGARLGRYLVDPILEFFKACHVGTSFNN